VKVTFRNATATVKGRLINRIVIHLGNYPCLPGWISNFGGELPVVHCQVLPYQMELVHPSQHEAVKTLGEKDHFLRYFWNQPKRQVLISLDEKALRFVRPLGCGVPNRPMYADISPNKQSVRIRYLDIEEKDIKRYFDIDISHFKGEFETALYFQDENTGKWLRLPSFVIRCGAV
jgi:hypothetical protein